MELYHSKNTVRIKCGVPPKNYARPILHNNDIFSRILWKHKISDSNRTFKYIIPAHNSHTDRTLRFSNKESGHHSTSTVNHTQ